MPAVVSHPIRIRRARSDDVELLLSIQRASAVEAFPQVFPPERYPFPDDEVRAAWTEALASHDVQTFIAESRGTSVGLVAIEGDYLRTLYVIPTAQRQGVGGALIDFAIERLKASGVRTAKFWTLEANARARSFYERRGWRLTDETRKVAFPHIRSTSDTRRPSTELGRRRTPHSFSLRG